MHCLWHIIKVVDVAELNCDCQRQAALAARAARRRPACVVGGAGAGMETRRPQGDVRSLTCAGILMSYIRFVHCNPQSFSSQGRQEEVILHTAKSFHMRVSVGT
ncbi:unnamed protein product [Prorocentrum cordatum]|uniref:Uncharacterized protein n=1 Tax=Prorocentrum cordatum TaxID=2364126 RepID=A0ABN9VTA4_9DINO|nr:unnamed protein product [Polarella glacialis]